MGEEVKVTNIGGNFHARYIVDGEVVSEWACELKEDIGFMSREMLRWMDKLGHSTNFTKSARSRQVKTKSIGKVWRIK